MEKVDAPEHVRAYLENVRSDVGGKFEGVGRLGRKVEKRGRQGKERGEGKRESEVRKGKVEERERGKGEERERRKWEEL